MSLKAKQEREKFTAIYDLLTKEVEQMARDFVQQAMPWAIELDPQHTSSFGLWPAVDRCFQWAAKRHNTPNTFQLSSFLSDCIRLCGVITARVRADTDKTLTATQQCVLTTVSRGFQALSEQHLGNVQHMSATLNNRNRT